MSYIQSIDGVTVGHEQGALPRFAVRLLTDDPNNDGRAAGMWSVPTADDHELFGWYEVTETPQPSAPNPWDRVERQVVNVGPGQFEEQWTIVSGQPNVAQRTGIDSFRDQDPKLAVAMGLMVMDMETVRNALGYLLQGAAAVGAAATRDDKIDAVVGLLEGFPAVFPTLDARAVVDLQLIDNAPDAQDGLMELRVADKRGKASAFLATPEGAAHAAAKAAELAPKGE